MISRQFELKVFKRKVDEMGLAFSEQPSESDKNVKGILINIFGGITRCDDIANGFKQGIEKVQLKLPISCRIVGTNDEKAKQIMNSLNIHVSKNMDEAVKNVVKLLISFLLKPQDQFLAFLLF